MLMREHLRELWAARELLRALVRRDLRVRYRGSYFGFAVSILVPIVQVAVLTIVFKRMTRFSSIENYSAHLFCGTLPWSFIYLTSVESCNCILKNRDIVKKVYFPREVLPLSVMLGNLIHLGFTMVLFLLYLFIVVRPPVLWTLAWLPVIFVFFSALALGSSFLFSVANTLLRDVEYLLSFAFTLGFFVTPILYPAGVVKQNLPEPCFSLYMLNPIAIVIEQTRFAILGAGDYPPPTGVQLVTGAAACVFALAIGYAVFRRLQWRLPELV